jgi:trehalose-6-phosphate synthase
MANLIERHREKIVGVLSCFDRLVLQGTLPSVAYPQAVATELDRREIAKVVAQLGIDAKAIKKQVRASFAAKAKGKPKVKEAKAARPVRKVVRPAAKWRGRGRTRRADAMARFYGEVEGTRGRASRLVTVPPKSRPGKR